MVDRIIDYSMWALMAILGFVAAGGVFIIATSANLGHYPLIIHGVRVMLGALGTLVVVAALHSIRRRLAAIETRLNDR